MSNTYFVYIATNDEHYVLYTGVTSSLIDRMYQHKNGVGSGFTKKYSISKLVYFEEFDNINDAIQREKQLKSGSRKQKESLVFNLNPAWKDLSVEFGFVVQ